MRTKRIYQGVQKDKYRSQDYKTPILDPIVRNKGQFKDYALDFKNKAPRFITGYTGSNFPQHLVVLIAVIIYSVFH